MAAITQQIPNYVLGISEQPDELKLLGQVKDLKNAIPDITQGCSKRAGSKLIKKITPNSGTLSWFHIYTDEDNQYIGNVNTSGVIQIWRTRDGFSYHDNNGQGSNLIKYRNFNAGTTTLSNQTNSAASYLSGWTESSDIQTLTLNQQTLVTNRTKVAAMKTSSSDKSPVLVNEAIIELKTIVYGKQYALDIFDPTNMATTTEKRATSIAARNDFASNVTANGAAVNDGSCQGMTREVINATATGKKNLRYEIDVRCQPVVDPDNLGGSSSGPQYDDAYQPFAKLQFGGEGWETGNAHSYTTEKGGTGTVEVKSHITITSRANIAKVRPPATSSSADENVSANSILGAMKEALDSISGTNITATIVGNCLHLKRPSAFSVTTPENQLMNIIANEANTVAELPSACRHNYVVKIVNSGDDDDDFYLKFKADGIPVTNTSTTIFGEGVWEECVAPNSLIEIDKETMPVKIVREEPGNVYPEGRFLIQEIDYKLRGVGDDNTNPLPSFIGAKIQKMLFFRNRVIVLSKSNVVASKTNDFFNFFSSTAMTETTSDPIDLQASSTFPTTIHDGIEVNSGLLLFSSNQQFMLTTDSDALTPTTAKINYLCSYNYNPKTKPFSLGTTSGFINSTGANARIFEMADVRREGEPTVLEQSKLISKLLPINIDTPTTSKENSLLLLGATTSNEVWGFRFYNTGEKRIQSAWFRWSLTGQLVHHVLLDDVYYLIVKDGTNYLLEAIDIRKQDDTKLIGTDKHLIHLDRNKEISSLASSAYDATTNKTVFPTPDGYDNSENLAAYNHNSGSNIGNFATCGFNKIVVPASTFTTNATNSGTRFIYTNHGFTSGNKVIYNAEGGAGLTHPSLGTLSIHVFYVYVIDANTFMLAPDYANSTQQGGIKYSAFSSGNDNQTLTNVGKLSLEGDWTGTTFMLGQLYDYLVELPTIYVTQQTGEKSRSDTRSSLVVHRLHISFGNAGNIDTTIKRKGRVSYKTNFNAAANDINKNKGKTFDSDELSVLQEYIHTVPVYERNTNLNIQIKSTHPTPATLHSMNWEGDYNQRYYRRV